MALGQRKILLACVGAVAVGSVAYFGVRRRLAGPEPARLEISDPARFWTTGGFVEMVPPIRLPSSTDESDRITVWLRVPDRGQIDVRWLSAQSRYTLKYPPGTAADRVEYYRGSVIDVRGTRFEVGAEYFHVYRPLEERPQAALVGTEWRRDKAQEGQRATEWMVRLLRGSPRFRAAPEARFLDRFVRLNDCASCHPHDKPEARELRQPSPRRATDADGLYVILTVLADSAPAEVHRPRDRNVDDGYVWFGCGQRPAQLVAGSSGQAHWVCPDGEVPIGHYDLARARGAGHPHAAEVCASRRYLFDHMETTGRLAFAQAYRECGLAP